jgi:hypothetical protein
VAPLADTGVPVLAFGISAALTCLVALVLAIICSYIDIWAYH